MFTHLHVHTEYSLLDGLGRIPALLSRARELGMDSLALTDHGVLYGAMEFYREAQKAGVKPIIGCEVYVAPNGHQSREPHGKNPYHLVLLAKDLVGYRNLIQLVSQAHLDGFYYKPRVDRQLLERHSQGLVALSACLQGEFSRLLREGRGEEAEAAARWHREVFGQDFYLELQSHAIPELEQVNRDLVSLARRSGLPLVVTNDVHYVAQDDAKAHDLLLCIGTNTSIHDEKRMRLSDDSYYLKSPAEMEALFPELPEAAANTQAIAARCGLTLEFGRLHLPQAVAPGQSAEAVLENLCREALPRRYPKLTPEIEARLDYELRVIRQTQFANYFLVVEDIIAFAKRQGILYGVRGSAAASLVLYCLGVTDLDPMAHRLVFERFLNVERREMPDIDLDFQDDRRGEVLAYVAQKYGREHVAQIITFGTLGARAALRDVGRALGQPYDHVDRVARLVPQALHIKLEQALAGNAELRQLYGADEAVRTLVDSAVKLEGTARHASTHAAGIVISQEPLLDLVPLQRPPKAGDESGLAMTQFPMEDIAQIGLLKMDLLGLINLTILEQTRKLVAQTRGTVLDLERLPLDDAQTYELLSSGETTGVFQLEGAGMRRFIKELRPSIFSDIAAMVALYRPGPMQHLPTFIAARHGRAPIRYPHPALEDILKETYGVIVYQDQVLLIAQTFAGYSLGHADIVRKAMGKKIPEVMRQERSQFIAGAGGQGFSPEVAQAVFDLIEPFAGYAFNKAHSVSYAMIAYKTAYLKANYPAEFMASLLNCYLGQAEKVAAAQQECQRLDIPWLPPSLNHSQEAFSLEPSAEGKPAIRLGLAAIKNVGAGALGPILAARAQGGPFRSLEDLCRRADLRGLNKRMLESLIKAGALDDLGPRGSLLQGMDRIIALSAREQRLKESGQTSMFNLWGEPVSLPLPGLELMEAQAPLGERLAWEKELLGIYLSGHPFQAPAAKLSQAGVLDTLCSDINQELAGQTVVTGGLVTSVRPLKTRDGRPFVAAVLEDLSGSVEVTTWPKVYEATKELWAPGRLLLVKGRVRARGEGAQVSCEDVREYREDLPLAGLWGEPDAPPSPRESGPAPTRERQTEPTPRSLEVSLRRTESPEADAARLNAVVALLRGHPGPTPVQFYVNQGQGQRRFQIPGLAVAWESGLGEGLRALLAAGEDYQARF